MKILIVEDDLEAAAYLSKAFREAGIVLDHASDGESGLFLHGMPYAIAPDEQTRVPMLMWFSPAYAQRTQLDLACLRTQAHAPASHDNVFHSVLGLLDIKTAVRDDALDLSATCKG